WPCAALLHRFENARRALVYDVVSEMCGTDKPRRLMGADWSSPPASAAAAAEASVSPAGAAEPSGQAACPNVRDEGNAKTKTEIASLVLLAPPQQEGELGRLGNYRVLKQLGEGGMGLVFHAEDVLLDRPVALKVMKPDKCTTELARRRFWQE